MYPSLQAGITNPPVTMTRNCNECLRECGHQLTAILINHHLECHQTMLKNIQLTINSEFQTITNEFWPSSPNSNQNLNLLRMKSYNSYNQLNDNSSIRGKGVPTTSMTTKLADKQSNCNSHHPTKNHQCCNTVVIHYQHSIAISRHVKWLRWYQQS